MSEERQHKIKGDEKDLQNLEDYVNKVGKLRQEFLEQKQEISSLNGIIQELKSQNEELRSQSAQKNTSNKDQIDSCHEEEKKKSIISQKSQNETKIKGNIVRVSKFEKNLDDKSFQSSYQSIRNHSSYLHQNRTRMLSPQFKFSQSQSPWNMPTMDSVNYDYNNNNSKNNNNNKNMTIHHENETKKRIISNLVEDLKDQVQRKQLLLQEEHEKYIQTKKQLRQKTKQVEKISEINERIVLEYDILEKENNFMKQELVKQTESRYQAEGTVKDLMELMKRKYLEQEEQFLKMDKIYGEFENIVDGLRR